MSVLAAAQARLAQERLFVGCVAGSLLLHALAFKAGWSGHAPEPVEVEFDLTLSGAALGPAGRPPGPARPSPAAAPESWTPAPKGSTAPEPAPAPEPITAEDGPAGTGAPGAAGAGAGGGGGSGVTVPPRLLDQSQLDRLLERYYPDSERRLGHEGLVLLDISLDDEGHVVGVDVVASSDPAFEPAARKTAARLRYAPARAGERAVSVKIRQPVQFRLSPR